MNQIRLLGVLLLLGVEAVFAVSCSATTKIDGTTIDSASVQETADPRTAPPSTEKPKKVIHPSGDFNIAEAKSALEPGGGTIVGAACVVKTVPGHSGMDRAYKQTVILYPASPYIEDMLNLIHKTKPGTADVEADPTVTAVRLEGKTNENGQFQFSKIKPGKYFVVADVHSTVIGSQNVYTGTGYGSDGFGAFTTDYYQKQHFSVNYEDILYQQVELTGDGTIHITLFKPGKWGFAGIALKPTCH